MSDLTEFLLARIAEDALLAKNAMGVPDWWTWRMSVECEAKRRIVEPWADGDAAAILALWMDNADLSAPDGVRHAISTMRALATVYTDHPDYRDEWRP